MFFLEGGGEIFSGIFPYYVFERNEKVDCHILIKITNSLAIIIQIFWGFKEFPKL